MKKKKLVILGSTGSIGTQTLDIVREHPQQFKIVGLTAYNNVEKLINKLRNSSQKAVCLIDESKASQLKAPSTTAIFTGEEGLKTIATLDSDLLINALVGTSGLIPTLEAIRKGITIGLANKETLVLAGDIVMREAAKHQTTIIPIDSEHSALLPIAEIGKRQKSAI